MNRQPPADAGTDRALATLVVKSHYRLADKPERTLEGLRVFFPGDADEVLMRLRVQPVAARRGDVYSLNAIAMAMRAQGFDVEVRIPTALDDDDALA